MERIIFHIDVNSAFLSWSAVELLKNGAKIDLRMVPAIIGGDRETRHGVVLAKSVLAKQYGIRTGEAVVNALRKYPDLQMEKPNHELYHRCSERLMEHLQTYTSDIEQVSVDECFLDFTGIAHLYDSPVAAAKQIQVDIYEKFGFTVNIGISENKLLAKMASDFKKPNKVHTLFKEEIQKKMWPLPVGKLYMAGKSSVEALRKLEILTIGDLANASLDILTLHLKSHGKTLWNFANGIGESILNNRVVENRGIGNSTTLAEDATSLEEGKEVLLWLAEKVANRLRMERQKANMISVEVRYFDFQNVSHQKRFLRATQTAKTIYHVACELFEEIWDTRPVRLLGIRTAKLVDEEEPQQMTLLDFAVEQRSDERHEKLEKAMDEIKERYGKNAVTKGTLL